MIRFFLLTIVANLSLGDPANPAAPASDHPGGAENLDQHPPEAKVEVDPGHHEHDPSAESHDGAPHVEEEYEVDSPEVDEPEMDWESINKHHEQDFLEEYSKTMEGFIPDTVLTLNMASDESFFQDITEPVLFRGVFMSATESGEGTIEVHVNSPSGELLYTKTATEGLWHLPLTEIGTYSVMFSNHQWMNPKTLSVMMGIGNSTTLQSHHINTVQEHLGQVEKILQDVQSESTYLWIRQRAHLKTVASINRRVLWFSMLEFFVLAAVSAFQLYYIKGLLSDRRVL